MPCRRWASRRDEPQDFRPNSQHCAIDRRGSRAGTVRVKSCRAGSGRRQCVAGRASPHSTKLVRGTVPYRHRCPGCGQGTRSKLVRNQPQERRWRAYRGRQRKD